MSIIIFILILAILILVHEFGHFIVAKKSGIRVDEFGLGFPPKIFAKKWGSTLYTLNTLPFGGFVKIFGEDPPTEGVEVEMLEEDRKTSFYYKPKWIQAAVLVAGVSMNIIFAWLVISLGFVIGLPTPVDSSIKGQVINPHLVVTEILVDSPAQKAGIHPGDSIISVSTGENSLQASELTPASFQKIVSESKTKSIEIVYKRGRAVPVTLNIEPNEIVVPGKRAIGVAMDQIGILRLPVHKALFEGGRTTILLTKSTIVGLAGFLKDVVTFHSDFSQVSGPVGIASVVSDANQLGFVYLLSLVALISINLAVINLLPFPALDGGRLLFVAIEAATHRPIPRAFVRWTNGVGFILLLILMVVITTHDILKLF